VHSPKSKFVGKCVCVCVAYRGWRVLSYLHWKRRTCLSTVLHSFSCSNQRKFWILQNQDCVFSSSSAEPKQLLQLVSCRTKSASSVRFLQKQDYVFISAAEEPRHLQFVLCRTKATALFHYLQNQDSVFISSCAEPIPPLQFFLLQN
jgi:hypothetical protein